MAKKHSLNFYTHYQWIIIVLAFLVGIIIGFLTSQGVSSIGLAREQGAMTLPPGPYGPQAQDCIAHQCQLIGCCSDPIKYWCEEANPTWCFG